MKVARLNQCSSVIYSPPKVGGVPQRGEGVCTDSLGVMLPHCIEKGGKLKLIIVGRKEYLIKKSRLLKLYAQFTVNSCQYALHLSKGKHAAKEGISGIVAARLVAKHCHAMVNAHWQVWILLLKYACQLNYVGTAAKMRSFGKVAVGENVA